MSYAQKLDDVALLLDELEGLEARGRLWRGARDRFEPNRGGPRAAASQFRPGRSRGVGRLDPRTRPSPTDRRHQKARKRQAPHRFWRAPIPCGEFGRSDDHQSHHSGRAGRTIHTTRWSKTFSATTFRPRRLPLSSKRVSGREKSKRTSRRRLAKSKGFVAMHASIGQMPQVLRDKLSASPLRAVYELYQLWKRDAARVEAFCAQHESFTRPQAEAFIEEASAKPNQIDDAEPATEHIIRGEPSLPQPTKDETKHGAAGLPEGEFVPAAQRKSASEVIMRVRHEQRGGRLILGRVSKRGSHFGIVVFDDHGDEAQVLLAELALVEIRMYEPL